MNDVNDTKGTTADRSENRDRGHGPEDEFQIEVGGNVGAVVGFADSHSQDGVGDQPDNDHIGTYGAIIIFLLLSLADAGFFHFESVTEVSQSFVVAGVNVKLLARHLQFDRVTFATHGGPKIDMDDVVAFGAPCDVVGVAKGVDLQRAYV